MNNQQPCKTYSRTELSFWCLMEWIVICIILLFLSVYYAMIVFLIIILWTSQGKFSVTRGLCITNFFPSPESVILSEFFYWKSLSHSLFHCGRHYLCTIGLITETAPCSGLLETVFTGNICQLFSLQFVQLPSLTTAIPYNRNWWSVVSGQPPIPVQ